jgi:O-antigen/teichoic acid export membrane protein
MATSRARLFLENFFIYGMAGVLGKAIPFVMLPIITRLIAAPVVFGKLELYRLMVSFGTPLVVLGMYDSMFRFFFENYSISYRKAICSSALLIVSIAGCIVLLTGVAISSLLTKLVFGELESRSLVYVALLVIFVSATQSIVSAPTRMQNQRKVYLIMNIILPAASYVISIPVIILGYPLFGLVVGSALSALISLVIFWHLNGEWFSMKHVYFEKIKELLKFGIPLAPTFFIYWIFNACDRLMIVHMIGQDAVGMYGIGSRLASISSIIYMAFSGGWQYFAFSTMNDNDHTRLMSNVFEVLGVLSVTSLFLLLPFVDWLFELFVGEVYRKASVVFPFLFLSPLLLMLYQILGNQVLVVKKSYLSTVILSIGALMNVVLNWVLIPTMGIKGAAIATLLGYIVSLALAFIVVKKMKLIYGNWRVSVVFGCGGLSLILATLWPNLACVISVAFLVLVLAIYLSRIKRLLCNLLQVLLYKKRLTPKTGNEG